MENQCLNCNSPIKKRKTYCDNRCSKEYLYKQYIERWKAGRETGLKQNCAMSSHIRRYLFQKYENKCCQCGWGQINPTTKKAPLEIEHKNGDWKDNREENLLLLCPNCHSLTPTYRNNPGKGRWTYRKAQYSWNFSP